MAAVTENYPEPERHMIMARRLVSENYNSHRNPAVSEEIPPDDFYVIWFSYADRNWSAVVVSRSMRSMLYLVTFTRPGPSVAVDVSGPSITIDIYRKLNRSKPEVQE